MEFEEFIRKMTKSAKDSNVHIMAFISDGKRVILTYQGDHNVIAGAVAIAMTDHPCVLDTIKTAVNLIDKQNMKFTVIKSEDEANDYLIDLNLNNKELNDSEEGL